MKKVFALLFVCSVFAVSCSREKASYVDLRTGKSIEVEKDPVTGSWVDKTTKEPVYIYVDTQKGDTIYGKTGVVINGHIVKSGEIYYYDDDLKEDQTVQGDIKIKTEDKKIKIEDGERKEKRDD